MLDMVMVSFYYTSLNKNEEITLFRSSYSKAPVQDVLKELA